METDNPKNSSENAPEQQPVPVNETMGKPTEKKSSHSTLLMVILALCLVSAGALYLINNNKTEVVEPLVTNSEKLDDEISDVEGLEGLQFTFDTTQQPRVEVYDTNTNRYYLLESTNDYTYVAQYIPKGDKSYPPEQVKDNFVKSATDNGYELVAEENTELANYLLQNDRVRLKKENIQCDIYASETEQGTGYIYRTCINTEDISTEAARLKPFYDSYEASKQYLESDYRGPHFVIVDEAFAEDSSIVGYQYLYGGVGDFLSGANASFVREVGGEWVFFIGRQSILNCEDYDTELFQKALAHETCQAEEGVQKTVKEYYNL